MSTSRDPISAARIRVLLAERSTAVEQGAKDRVKAIDKELAGHGYTREATPQSRTTAPVERKAPPKEAAAPPAAGDKPASGKGKAKGKA